MARERKILIICISLGLIVGVVIGLCTYDDVLFAEDNIPLTKEEQELKAMFAQIKKNSEKYVETMRPLFKVIANDKRYAKHSETLDRLLDEFKAKTTIPLTSSRGAKIFGILVVICTLILYFLFSPIGLLD